jgi:hypothetical protein
VLARRDLQKQINKLRADEQAADSQPVQDFEPIKLQPAEYARLLQKLYEKTFGPITTNQPASAPTNTPSAAAPPPEKKSDLLYAPSGGGIVRGGEMLMRHENAQRHPPKEAVPAAPIQPPPIAVTAAAAPSAPDVAQMEQKLLAQIHVADDAFRELIQARARAVQAELLASGQIAASRLSILPPKSINVAAQGETRANFSLE